MDLRARRSFYRSWALIGWALLFFATPPVARAGLDEVLRFGYWETQGNGASVRSNEKIQLFHYEIPLELMKADFATDLDPKIRDALVFERGGRKFFRWVINPEDTKWHLKVKEFLESRGLSAEPQTYLEGQLSASRSLIVRDPHSGAAFMLKTSTNQTGGSWTDKKQYFNDSFFIRAMDEHLRTRMQGADLKTLVLMREPAAFGIEELDLGISIRDMGEMARGDKTYLPGFSALHEHVGVEIARLNGVAVDEILQRQQRGRTSWREAILSRIPGTEASRRRLRLLEQHRQVQEFWFRHYIQPLGRALAEFYRVSGAWYNSPHSQNFLIELDRHGRPTGRIVLRDFGDVYLQADFLKQLGRDDLLDLDRKNGGSPLEEKAVVRVGPFHGNVMPSWTNQSVTWQWMRGFFNSFETRLSELTEIPSSELKATRIFFNPATYGSKIYQVRTGAWQTFFAAQGAIAAIRSRAGGWIESNGGRRNNLDSGVLRCEFVLN